MTKTNLTAPARAESDANMCAVTVYVNDRLHHHYGRSPKRNPALQAFIAVYLLRERALGIDTIVKAAVATGTTRAAVHAALIVLQNGMRALRLAC